MLTYGGTGEKDTAQAPPEACIVGQWDGIPSSVYATAELPPQPPEQGKPGKAPGAVAFGCASGSLVTLVG